MICCYKVMCACDWVRQVRAQCVAVCCGVLWCVAVSCARASGPERFRELHKLVAVCCSVL